MDVISTWLSRWGYPWKIQLSEICSIFQIWIADLARKYIGGDTMLNPSNSTYIHASPSDEKQHASASHEQQSLRQVISIWNVQLKQTPLEHCRKLLSCWVLRQCHPTSHDYHGSFPERRARSVDGWNFEPPRYLPILSTFMYNLKPLKAVALRSNRPVGYDSVMKRAR